MRAITRAISARCPRRRSSVVAGEHRGPVLDCGTGLRRVRGMRAACVWPPLGAPLETAPSVSKREGNHQRHQRVSPMTARSRSERSQALGLQAICLALTSPSARAHLARPPLETAPSVSNHKGNHRRSHQRALPTTALERRRGRASRSSTGFWYWMAARARHASCVRVAASRRPYRCAFTRYS